MDLKSNLYKMTIKDPSHDNYGTSVVFNDVQLLNVSHNLNDSTSTDSDIQESYGYYYHILYIIIVPIVFAFMVLFGM